MPKEQTYVIVGASLAGAKAAESLRTEGFAGRIVLVGDDPERPYERPPLSKDYLRGDAEREKVVRVTGAGFYAEQRVELRTGDDRHRVGRGPTRHASCSSTARGARATTGCCSPPGAGSGRSPSPALSSRACTRCVPSASPMRLVAAASTRPGRRDRRGLDRSEVAASARVSSAPRSRWSIPRPSPSSGVLGARSERSTGTARRVTESRCTSSTGVDRFVRGATTCRAVDLTDGARCRPTSWSSASARCPASTSPRSPGWRSPTASSSTSACARTRPDVFAAGDVASAVPPGLGAHIRVEHWANALQRRPGRRPLDARVTSSRTRRMPYFFSDQYDLGMEYRVGDAGRVRRVVFRGDPDSGDGEFVAFWVRRRAVVAGMNANVWDVTDQIQRLVRDHVSPSTPAQLADPRRAARHVLLGRRSGRTGPLDESGVFYPARPSSFR